MRQDKLTTAFQNILADAQSIAANASQPYIEPLHVLEAILNDSEGTGRSLLERAGVRVPALAKAVRQALAKIPAVSGGTGDVQASRDLIAILNQMDREATVWAINLFLRTCSS